MCFPKQLQEVVECQYGYPFPAARSFAPVVIAPMGNNGQPISAGAVSSSLIECVIEPKAFRTLDFDMTTSKADNIRAIATAAELYPPSRFHMAVLPKVRRELQLARFSFRPTVHSE